MNNFITFFSIQKVIQVNQFSFHAQVTTNKIDTGQKFWGQQLRRFSKINAWLLKQVKDDSEDSYVTALETETQVEEEVHYWLKIQMMSLDNKIKEAYLETECYYALKENEA